MSEAAIGVGVAGLGAIGRVHAENLRCRVSGARLIGVADVVESTACEAGRDLGVDWSTSFERLISDPRLDAVVIATPASTHFDLVERAACARKHVFCEKPLGDDAAGAAIAVDCTHRAGVLLQVGFQRRFDPDFVAIHRRLASGSVGPVRIYRSRMRNEAPPPAPPGERRLLVDAACHELDAARWLAGEVEEVAVISDDAVDSAVLALRFAGGAIGAAELTYLGGYGFDCGCEIVAEHATVRVDGSERGVPRTFLERFGAAYRLELAGFAHAVRTGTEPRVTGEDGLAAVVLCEAAERSRVERRCVAVKSEVSPEPRAIPG